MNCYLNSTNSWGIETRKYLHKANLIQDEILDKTHSGTWEAGPEQDKPKHYRPKWSEKKKHNKMIKQR